MHPVRRELPQTPDRELQHPQSGRGEKFAAMVKTGSTKTALKIARIILLMLIKAKQLPDRLLQLCQVGYTSFSYRSAIYHKIVSFPLTLEL